MTDIYKEASRKQLRFSSTKGDLTVEQLWQLPLQARGADLDLDTVALGVQAELQTLEAGSFVRKKPKPRQIELALQLEILKDVVASKIAEEEAAEVRAANTARKDRIKEILARKEDEELAAKSKEELLAEIGKL